MKKYLLIKQIALLACCLLPFFGSSQDTLGPISPGGIFDKIYDRFGNEYKLKDLVISTAKSQTFCTNSGYFDLYFEAGSGFEQNTQLHADRRAVLCQLFNDLSAFIFPANANQKVNIWIRDIDVIISQSSSSNVLGLASSFHTMPGNAPSVTGIADNEIWKTIHTGQDPYQSIVSPLYTQSGPNLGFYHGVMAFNFNNPGTSWYLDLTSPPTNGTHDLYTVALHEITHALGFASLISANGQSRFAASGYNYYSRYDTYLKNQANQNLIVNTGTCSLYNFSFNPALNAISTLAPNPSNCIPNNTSCGTAIKFAGSVNQAVYTPNCFDPPSSLSHFEDQCHLPNAYANDAYYVMSNNGFTGPGSMKRFLKPEERKVLCDIGYKVNSWYGNALYAANYFNYNVAICPGITTGGVNDGLSASGAYTLYTLANTGISFSGSDILSNDVNAASFECLESVYNNGVLSFSGNGPGATISYTPNVQGTHLLRYIPVSSSGQRGNITYIFIKANSANCASAPCSMIKNGGFESGSSCGEYVWVSGPVIDCWEKLGGGSPDYLYRYCTANPAEFTLPSGTWLSNPPSDSWNGIAANNNHVLGLRRNEGMQTPLNSPILPNVPYTLSFWAKMPPVSWLNPNMPASFQFRGHPSFSALGPVNLLNNFNNFAFALTSVTLSPTADWQYISLNFTYTGAQPLNSLYMANMGPSAWCYFLFDDINLLPTASAPGFSPPSPICQPSQLTNLGVYASPPGGIFSGNEVVYDAVSGTYSFNPQQEGSYHVLYTYTNNLGCQGSIPAQIQVIKPETPTITVTSSSNNICAGANVTLTASGASTYTWNPVGACVYPCNVSEVSPNATTVYTVTGSPGLGCLFTASSEFTLTVSNPSVCCAPANSVMPNNHFSVFHPASLSNLVIDVMGLYTINTNMVFTNVIFRMAPNATIVVNATNTLTLNNCKLFSCSSMWDGIYLKQNGLNAGGLKVINGTSIEDAINGIVANSNTTQIGSNILIENSTLNKNYKSIQVLNYTGSNYLLTLKQSTISCANSAYSFGPTLKAPYLNNRSTMGVLLSQVSRIKIGSTALSSDQNVFDNLDYGIYSTKTNVTVQNNRFNNITGSFPFCPAGSSCPSPKGIAVFVPNSSPASNTLMVGGSNANEANVFMNVLRAVEGDYLANATILRNTASNAITSPVFDASAGSGLTGQYAVLIANVSQTLAVRNNVFVNFANTISYNRNNLSTNAYNPLAAIESNSILPLGASGYVNTGIFVSDLASNTIGGVSTLFIRNNQLMNIKVYGINVHYIKNRPVISGTGYLTQSVSMLLTTASSWGIRTLACDRALITNNKVVSTGNTNINMYGIYLERSTNSRVQCNYIYNTGNGITIHGNCQGPYTAATNYESGITANTFTATGCGIRLRNSGEAGRQGDITHPTFNVWMGLASSYAFGQTRTDAVSIPTLSSFYTTNAQTPTNHVTVGGTAYMNGVSILNASGIFTACPGPSAIEELPDTEVEEEGVSGRYGLGLQAAGEADHRELLLYPNPGTGVVYLESSEEVFNAKIRVIDVIGRIVFENTVEKLRKEELDLSSAPKGLYMVEIQVEGKKQFYKMILQ